MKKANKLKIGVFVFLLSLLVVYIGFGSYYSSRFLPGTTVYGQSIGQLTKDQAEAKLTNKLNETTYTLRDGDKVVGQFTGKDIGLKVDYNSDLTARMTQQNPWLFKTSQTVNATQNQGFDEASAKSYLSNLLNKENQSRTESKNASIQRTGNQGFQLVSETQGNQFNVDNVMTYIIENIQSGNQNIQLNDQYIKPTVTSDNTDLQNNLKKLNNVANVSGAYTIGNNTEVVSNSLVLSWVDFKDNKINFDETAMRTYLRSLNQKYGTVNKSRIFKTTSGAVVTVPAGTYGWSINVESELSQLKQDIFNGNKFSRQPKISGSGYNTSGTDIGDTYVEVNIASQKLWIYKQGQLVLTTDVVTGLPGQDTPKGVWAVWSKQQNAVLRGLNNDGSPYASPVNYWMPIDNTGVGLHDANWQPKFGGTWYQTHGSHGCINISPSVMPKVYEAVAMGTPVVIY
ncbi:L,D-transpeptidase family protein [Holzapfeliella sp. JNUCC 80]